MSKMIKKYLQILLIGILLFLKTTNVFADEKISLETNKKTINAGDTITLTVTLNTDYESLYAIKAKLSYDKDVFSVLDDKSVEKLDNNSEIIYNEENNEFVILNKDGYTKNNLLKINLKVKEDALAGKTTLNLSDFEASDGNEIINYDNQSINVVINKGITNNEASLNETKEINDSNSETKYTISFKPAMIILTITLVFLIVAIILINSSFLENLNIIKKENKKKTSVIIGILIFSIGLLTIILNCINITNKGDVNKDGEKNYDDVREISEYLLNITNSNIADENNSSSISNKSFRYYNADYNNDGKITISDVASLTEDLKEKVNYKANVTISSISNYYPNKNDKIAIDFKASIIPDNEIAVEGIYINNKYYSVNKNPKIKDNYTLNINVPNKAGIFEQVISKIKLTNGNIIEIKPLTFKVDVLKEIPSIKNFRFDESKNKTKASLEVIDNDNALEKGHLTITTENGNIAFEKEITKGLNEFSVELEKNIIYYLNVTASYDLDTDLLNAITKEQNEKKNQSFIYNRKIEIYKANLNLVSINNYYPQKEEEVTLSFNADIYPNLSIKEVIINDKKYSVRKNDNTYLVTVKAPNKSGIASYNISTVILENDLEIETDLNFKVDVLKTMPKITNFKVEKKDDYYLATFNLSDKEKALTNAKLIVTDDSNKKIYNEDIKEGANEFKLTLKTGAIYTLNILGSYDLDTDKLNSLTGEKNEVKSQALVLEYQIKLPKVTINNISLSDKYPHKNDLVTVNVNATILPETNIKEFIINDKTYKVTNNNSNYTFTIQAPNTAGLKKYKITKVVLEDDTKLETNYEFSFETLKDKPTIKNFLLNENKEKTTVSFDIEDEDNAFKSGKIVIVDKTDNKKTELIISKEVKEYPLELDKNKDYYLDLYISYDLDNNKLSTTDNEFSDHVISNYEIKSYKTSLSLQSLSNYYPNKNEEIIVSFTAQTTPFANIKEVIIDGKKYPVQKNESNYLLKIPSLKKAKVYDYKITNVILENNVEIKANLEFKFEVLKDKPTIENFILDESKSTPKLTFDLIDKDNAFKSGKVVVIDEVTNKKQEYDIIKGSNSFDLKLENDNKYLLNIYLSYDLDTNALTKDDNSVTDLQVEEYKDYEIKKYNANLKLSSVTNYYPERDEDITVTFTADVYPLVNIKQVLIDDKIYDVNLSEGTYSINLKAPTKPGVKEYKITKVILENNIEVLSNLSFKIDVLKKSPTIEEFQLEEDETTQKVSFYINDDEKALISGKIEIYNSLKMLVKTIEGLKEGVNKFEFDLEQGNEYTLNIKLTYDLDTNKLTESSEEQNKVIDKIVYTKNISIYKAKLTLANLSKAYPNKGEQVTVDFKANVNPIADIKEVIINNKHYAVVKNNDTYSFTVDPEDTAGVKKYQITSVILDNNLELDTKLNFSFDVLKEMPKVENFMFNSDNHQISFTLKDVDKALKKARVELISQESGISVFSKELDVNKNNYTLDVDLALGGTYTVNIVGDYDLDSDKENTENYYSDYVFYNNSITIDKLYFQSITDLNNLYPKQKQDIEFAFYVDIKPNTNIKVRKVLLDGIEKDVTFKDNHYVMTIEGSDKYGIQKHKITEIILEDNTKILCDFNIKYDVLKDEPIIKDFVYHDKSDKITFTLDDKDDSLNDAKLVITRKDNNKVVLEEKLDLDKIQFEYEVNLKKGVKYDAKIIGSYDLDSDKNNNKNEFNGSLYNYELTTYGVELSHIDGNDTYYVKKNSEVNLKFKAEITPEDNGSVINSIVIDNDVYDVARDQDGYYNFSIIAPSTAGEKRYTITKVILGDTELNSELSFNIDVLKDAPTIENLYIDETKNSPLVTFTLKDEDNSLDENNPGFIIIKNSTLQEVKKIAVKKGSNTLDLKSFSNDLKEGEVYYLDIKVNYDLDSNKENSKYEVTDASLVENHEIKIYKVNLVANLNNFYVNKEKQVPIAITAGINPNDLDNSVKIKTFIMDDDTEYNAIYNENPDANYSINLKAPKKAGLKKYNIKKVILTNDIEVKASLIFSVDVLKDVPYINKFNFNYENGSLNFELVDDDNAFKDGIITVYDDANQKVKSAEVKEKTTITYKFLEDKIYNVKVVGNYNLDSDKTDDNNAYNNEEMFTHSFMIGGDYNFKITDVSITDSLQKNEKPVVSFISTNTRGATVQKVTIDSKEYEVTKVDGNYYEVLLNDADTTSGKHTITLDKVVLSTTKTFKNKKDYNVNNLTYNVLKETPSIKNIKLTNNNTDKTITATFSLNDIDYTLTRLTAILLDSDNKIIASKQLSPEEIYFNNSSVTLSYQDNNDGHIDGYYKVRFLADYDLGADKYRYSDKNIGEADILTQKDEIYIDNIYITNSRNQVVDNPYPTKGQKNYQIAFDVHVGDSINSYARSKYGNRAYQKVSVITINGVNYNAEQISGYKSKVTLTVPEESGILNLTVNRVQLEYADYNVSFRQFYSVPQKSIKIDVLKDKPKIKNLNIKEDYENQKATFDFDVVLDDKAQENDESFKGGTIALGTAKKDIKIGHNSITFENIMQDINYDLIFNASYDLDTDSLGDPDKNENVNVEIHKLKYGLFDKETYKNISIVDGKAISAKNNKYFEKNEKIKLNFNITGINEELNLEPEKVIIKDKEYTLTKTDDAYEIIHDGYNTFGEKDITITDIILNNGKKVTLKDSYTIKPEVLKDVIEINNYKYEPSTNDIKISFNLKDYDGSLVGKAHVKITDENGKVIVDEEYKNEFTIKREKDILRYYVLVTGDYDRDIDVLKDSDNYYKNVKFLDEIISFDNNNIELKNITDINLYKVEKENGEDVINLKDKVDISDLKADNEKYFVEINMEQMPSVRANIKEIITKDNQLVLVLDYKYITNEISSTKELRINYGTIENNVATNETHPDTAFLALLKKLQNNEEVTLNKNYDASTVKVDTNYYVDTFTGTLDGNGFKIKNLQKPLFNLITNGGTVKNLTLENVVLDGKGRGALSNEAKLAKINAVIVDRVNKTSSSEGRNGGLIGNTSMRTTIENCAVKNVNLNGGYTQQNAGLIGYAENTIVKNTYVTGRVSSGHNFSAGFIANSTGCTITNSYAKVSVSGPISCNFGCSYLGSSTYENDISLGTGGNNGFVNKYTKLANNYHLVNDNSESNTQGITNITQDKVDNSLFKNAGFDEKIWRLTDASYDNTPTLQIEKFINLSDTSNTEYDENKGILYNNLMKLMPFYDSDKIIESAKNITDDYLNNKEIKHILPIDKNGNIVTYLTTDDIKKISKIKIVYKTKEKKEYDVIYDNTYDFVASYRILDLKVDYTYNHYVIDTNSQVVNNLTNYLKKLNYTDNLDILTSAGDSRLYKDFYNENTSKELKEFVLKFLSNSNYTNVTNDESINTYIEREVRKNKEIEKVLYMYNYFKRFYGLEIDGMMLSDFMLFNMQGFDEKLTPLGIANLFLADSSNFNTNETNTKYASVLGSYTNMNTISKFLEYMVSEFSDEDMDNWIAKQFKGYLVEIPVEDNPEIQYTLWDHFSNEDAKYNKPYQVYNYILPILTLPKNAAYIISSPVQFIIGAQRTYFANPDDPKEQELFRRKVASYTERMSNYYNTAYDILQDVKVFNDIHTFQLDKRFTKGINGETIFNNPYATEEPFHKNFNEAVGQWAFNDYNAATANGTAIIWRVEGVMDGNLIPELGNVQAYTFETWSHESAHNIDSRLFLRDNGRRYDAGGEDYADSNLTQSFGQNDIIMNLSVKHNAGSRIGSNLNPARIDSPDKVHDFYNKLFQTLYIMDYIEGKAFLQLDPSEQSGVAVQAMYPNENIEDQKCDSNGKCTSQVHLKYKTTVYQHIEKEKFEQMKLDTLDDLYKQKLVIFPGVYYSTYGDNRYGGEGINKAHWYQPHNSLGRPDSYSIKWLAYEMLGYKGYNDGYIEYYSNINANSDGTKNDIMALEKITGYKDFEKYKKARFDEVDEKLAYINNAIDVNEYLQKFYEAMKKDAEYANQKIAEAWERYPATLTDDASVRARGNLLSNAKVATNSTNVRYDLYYALKNATDDFEKDVYMKTKQQDISKFQVNKSE